MKTLRLVQNAKMAGNSKMMKIKRPKAATNRLTVTIFQISLILTIPTAAIRSSFIRNAVLLRVLKTIPYVNVTACSCCYRFFFWLSSHPWQKHTYLPTYLTIIFTSIYFSMQVIFAARWIGWGRRGGGKGGRTKAFN